MYAANPPFLQQQSKDPNPYLYYPYPAWEPSLHHQRMMSPMFGQPSPYHCSMMYPNAHFHACCNCSHSHPDGLYHCRQPFPQEVSPPQYYHQMPLPPYASAYPSSFMPPPHPFAVYHSPYDDPRRVHCCGCMGHACQGRNDGNVKSDEKKVGTENAEIKSNNSNLTSYPNYQFPMLLLPPTSMSQEDLASNMKQMPQTDHQKGVQVPWPFVWMPGCDKPAEPVKDKEIDSVSPLLEASSPRKIKIVPLTFPEDRNGDENTTRGNKSGNSEVGKAKDIPVPQAKDMQHSTIQKGGNAETISNDGQQKPTKASRKEGGGKANAETSLRKQSKLPPVCLRVDPLPKKKPSNASRSPSPPNRKTKEQTLEENSEAGTLSNPATKDKPQEGNEIAAGEKKVAVMDDQKRTIKVIQVEDGSDGQAREVPCVHLPAAGAPSAGSCISEVQGGAQKAAEENRTAHEGRGHPDEKATISMKRPVSESEAAITIQSAFRGYSVRRLRPLEKLQNIFQVHKQTQDVKREIEELETSSEKLEARKQMAIGETIMNLLMRLDTIQGLHPYVREVRKCAARELTSLQEKLDLMGSKIARSRESTRMEEQNSDGMEQVIDMSEADTLEEPPRSSEEKQVVSSAEQENDDIFAGDDSTKLNLFPAEQEQSCPVAEQMSDHTLQTSPSNALPNTVNLADDGKEILEEPSELCSTVASTVQDNSDTFSVVLEDSVDPSLSAPYESTKEVDVRSESDAHATVLRELASEMEQYRDSSDVEQDCPNAQEELKSATPVSFEEVEAAALSLSDVVEGQELAGTKGNDIFVNPSHGTEQEPGDVEANIEAVDGCLTLQPIEENTAQVGELEAAEGHSDGVDNGANITCLAPQEGPGTMEHPKAIDCAEQLNSPGYASSALTGAVQVAKSGETSLEKLAEENSLLRDMIRQLHDEGKGQLEVISRLSKKLRILENRVAQRKSTSAEKRRMSAAAAKKHHHPSLKNRVKVILRRPSKHLSA